MADPLQRNNSAGCDETTLPAEFIAVCVLAFVAGVSATAYFCRSMCCETEIPGGWTMSMMWMRMPGQTWFASALSFQFMWLAMMVAMMMVVAIVMAAEKLLPRPAIVARLVGISAIIAGVASFWAVFLRPG